MSFSGDIKQELNNLKNLANKELVKYELIGYFLSGNVSVTKNDVIYTTESDYNINRFSKLLSNLNIDHNIDISGKIFVINIKKKNMQNKISILENENYKQEILEKENDSEKLRAIVRGMFLGSGSINNPDNKYHLEISFSNFESFELAESILKKLDINVKIMTVKNKYYVYLKEGEEISKMLALIGANNAVMKFEDIRIQREMRGKVNRLVNCETANLNKTLNASVEQISAIKKIKEKGKFNKLNDNLKEIAELRLEYPDMALSELGKKLSTPVGKSGVNYRLKKIIEIAEGL